MTFSFSPFLFHLNYHPEDFKGGTLSSLIDWSPSLTKGSIDCIKRKKYQPHSPVGLCETNFVLMWALPFFFFWYLLSLWKWQSSIKIIIFWNKILWCDYNHESNCDDGVVSLSSHSYITSPGNVFRAHKKGGDLFFERSWKLTLGWENEGSCCSLLNLH